jgi:hypothetical protein
MDAFPADPCQAGDWGRFLPGHTTAVSLLAAPSRECRGHRRRLLPHARSQSQERNHPEQELTNPRGGDFYLATSGDRNLAVDR